MKKVGYARRALNSDQEPTLIVAKEVERLWGEELQEFAKNVKTDTVQILS